MNKIKMVNFMCRTCLYACDDQLSFKSIQKVREILELCIPEIKLYIDEKAILCSQCYYMLKNVNNFRQKCLENEKKLTRNLRITHLQDGCENISIQPIFRVVTNVTSVKEVEENENHQRQSVIIINPKPSNLTRDDENQKVPDFKSDDFIDLLNSSTNINNENLTKDVQSGDADEDTVIEISDDDDATSFVGREELILKGATLSSDYDDTSEIKFTETIVETRDESQFSENPCFYNKRGADGYYTCIVCYKKYKTSNGLYHHTQNKHQEVQLYHCSICNFFTAYEQALKRHHTVFHFQNSQKFYRCDQCSYATKLKTALRLHIREYHYNLNKNLRCIKCDVGFYKREVYECHMLMHGESRYYSDFGETRWKQKVVQIEEHFQCYHCGAKYLRKEALSKHMYSHKK